MRSLHLLLLPLCLATAAHARSFDSEYQLLRAMQWQLTQIAPDGEVRKEGNTRTGLGQEKNFSGGPKGINHREVSLALCYHAMVHDDPSALALAAKVFSPEKDEP